MTTFRFQRLTAGSVYKLTAIGIGCSVIPFTILIGISGLFGGTGLKWNGHPVAGFTGLIASPLIGLFIATVFTLFAGTSCAIGLWIFALFKPLELHAYDVNTKMRAGSNAGSSL